MRVCVCALVACLFALPAHAQTLPPDVCATLTTLRGSGPLTREQLGSILNRVAWQHRMTGWGLSRKEGGNRCPAPHGQDVACDILVHGPTNRLYDVLGDVDGAARVVCGQTLGPPPDPSRGWLPPVDPGGPKFEPEPNPNPVPGGQPGGQDVKAELNALLGLLTELSGQVERMAAFQNAQFEAARHQHEVGTERVLQAIQSRPVGSTDPVPLPDIRSQLEEVLKAQSGRGAGGYILEILKAAGSIAGALAAAGVLR